MAYYPSGSPYGQEPPQQPTPRRRRSAQQPPQYEPPQYQPQQYPPQQYAPQYQQQPQYQQPYQPPVYQQPQAAAPVKQKKKRSKWKIFLIVCAVLFVMGTILNALTPPYTVMDDTRNFVRDGKLGNVYSVKIDPKVSNFQLQLVFNEVIRGDGAPIHAVFFSSPERYESEYSAYDVAFMTDENGTTELERK